MGSRASGQPLPTSVTFSAPGSTGKWLDVD
jgi:hypothetical protein